MSKIVWGITAGSHDASLSVFEIGQIGSKNYYTNLQFASSSERFSRIKNDSELDQQLIDHALSIGSIPDQIVWYERPFQKTLRQWRSRQGWNWKQNNPYNYLKQRGIFGIDIDSVSHHHSHAAGGYYTSRFEDAVILVIDSIGEWETVTAWQGQGDRLTKIYSQKYPDSIGLWYTAMTQRIGLRPNEDEYVLMGMAAWGDPDRLRSTIEQDFFENLHAPNIMFTRNLHQGCADWRPDLSSEQDHRDIAAAVQAIYESILVSYFKWLQTQSSSVNLVLAGGCALNCVANSRAFEFYDRVWINPNPGDSGSAVGAVLARYPAHMEWPHTYLGYDMNLGKYPVRSVVDTLLTKGIAGVAHGAAEWGPRSLGNRSLLADPRGIDIKARVNAIKQRQEYRPFAPSILAEHAEEYFDGPVNPYMQFVSRCRRPDLYPAIAHIDGTSRVQTVDTTSNPGYRLLLEEWYRRTGCPMLLNTSLNIRGEPIVNCVEDAVAFQTKYSVDVYVKEV